MAFIEVKSDQFLPSGILEELRGMEEVLFIKIITCTSCIGGTQKNLSAPFITAAEMLGTIETEEHIAVGTGRSLRKYTRKYFS